MLIPPLTPDDLPPEDRPIDHVERPPLPWRESKMTECGLPAAGHPVISRAEFMARLRQLGKKRAAFLTCMTCLDTAQKWPDWDESPVACISREVYRPLGRYTRARSSVFGDELLALAELVARHREEFGTIMAGLGEAVRLSDQRRARAARRRSSG